MAGIEASGAPNIHTPWIKYALTILLLVLTAVAAQQPQQQLPICPPEHPHKHIYRFWTPGVCAMRPVGEATKHVIVLDAGSTGTRVHLFPYTRQKLGDSDSLSLAPGEPYFKLFPPLTKKVKPGLSTIVLDYLADMAKFNQELQRRQTQADSDAMLNAEGLDYPEPLENRVIDSLQPLLRFVRSQVSRSLWHTTPILVSATGGVRLLKPHEQEELMDVVRRYLEYSGFMFHRGWARVISGSQEGIFTWLAVVYARGNIFGRVEDPEAELRPLLPFAQLDRELEHDGVVELGGASLQITYPVFYPTPSPPQGDLERANATGTAEIPEDLSKALDTNEESDVESQADNMSESGPTSSAKSSFTTDQSPVSPIRTPTKFVSRVQQSHASDPKNSRLLHSHVVHLMHQAPVHVFTTSYPVFGVKKAYESVASQFYTRMSLVQNIRKEPLDEFVEGLPKATLEANQEYIHPCLPLGQRTTMYVLVKSSNGTKPSQAPLIRPKQLSFIGGGNYLRCVQLLHSFFDTHLGSSRPILSPDLTDVYKDPIHTPPSGPLPYGDTRFFASENFFHTRSFLIEWWDDLIATIKSRLTEYDTDAEDPAELTALVSDVNTAYAQLLQQWPRYLDPAPVAAETYAQFKRVTTYGLSKADNRRRLRSMRRSRRRITRRELANGVLRLRDLIAQRGLAVTFAALQDLKKHGLSLPPAASQQHNIEAKQSSSLVQRPDSLPTLLAQPIGEIWKRSVNATHPGVISSGAHWTKRDYQTARDGNVLVNMLMTLGSLYCRHGVRHVSPGFYADIAPRRLAVHCFASAYVPVLMRRVLNAGFETRRKISIDQVVNGWPVEWPLGAAAHLLASRVLRFQQLVERRELQHQQYIRLVYQNLTHSASLTNSSFNHHLGFNGTRDEL